MFLVELVVGQYLFLVVVIMDCIFQVFELGDVDDVKLIGVDLVFELMMFDVIV